MQLSLKLGLATALGISATLAANGFLRVQEEMALFESDMSRDHQTFGRALALAAQAVARRHGFDEAREMIEAANSMEPRLTIEFIEGRPSANEGQPVSAATLLSDGPLPELVSEVPTDLSRSSFVRMSEKRDAQRERVRRVIIRLGVTTAALIAVSTAIIFALGQWLLGRPLRLLVTKVRRIGEGDLSAPLVLRHKDEMGVLAHELNAMCDQLGEARHRLVEEADARVRAVEQLRHADRLGTLGRLAAGVAHELGTPLNVVSAQAKMIVTGESAGEEVRQDAQVILDQSERMTHIIRQLLDFTRQRRSDRREEDVRAVVGAALDVLVPLAGRAGVKCVLETGPQALAAVDPVQIQQVVTNLIVNAVQSQPRGGEVRVRVEQSHAPGRDVCIRVEDRGEGMAPEVLERVFEPFFTTKDVGLGSGLGLSVAHGIVEEHGGRIEAHSTLGAGSVFLVYLPAGGEP
jgi:two-component system NtrC family sensor kinase